MTLFSRTPEDKPARCPTCHDVIGIAPSRPTGEVVCPRCRALIWFVRVEDRVRCYPQRAVSPRKRTFIAALTESSCDSLDMVELAMELEEEFGPAFETRKMSEFPSLGELIDYIIRELPD
ncbi:MAG TPA: acyl carrier protein [Gemmataceae bacterium]|jgi:acyl carrier protein